ncbi:unnamed protein product [Phytophthora lilii]|uniref:Unnamed protein product n=1 Tax=Phytophthora lilii TaxID=2077276 RepID=A0A9W6WFG0_9STRA|nr:unnamed protein product [Phytophthora lilii]
MVDANKDISSFQNLTATNLTGTLQTAAQPNITSVGTLSSLTLSNSIWKYLWNADHCSKPNITSVGTLSSLTVSGNISGTLTTASQPNITSVGTLSSLTTTNTITTNINNNTTTLISYSRWNNTLATNMIVAMYMSNIAPRLGTTSNHAFRLASNNTVAVWIDASQNVNIGSTAPSGTYKLETTTANFTSLYLSGTQVTSTAAELNYLTGLSPGYASRSKALVCDASFNIRNLTSVTATNFYGTLQFAAQPNITSTGNLTLPGSLTISNGTTPITCTNTTSSSTFAISIQFSGGAQDIGSTTAHQVAIRTNGSRRLTCDASGNVDIVAHNGSTLGLKLGGTLVTATAADLNGVSGYGTYLSGITPGSVAASKAMVTNSSAVIQFGSGTSTTNQIKYFANTSLRDSIRIYRVDDSSPLTIGTRIDGSSSTNRTYPILNLVSSIDASAQVGGSYKSGYPHTSTLAASADAFAINVAGSSPTPSAACLYLVSDTINKMMYNTNTPYSSSYGTAPVTLNQGNMYIKCSNALNDGTTSFGMPLYVESSNSTPVSFAFQLSNGVNTTSTNSAYMGTVSSNDFVIMTGNSRKMTITSAGRVRIGVSSPSTILHVSGTVSNTFNVGGSLYALGGSIAYNPDLILLQMDPPWSCFAMFSGPIQCSSIYCTSDRRVKENIELLDESYCDNFFKADVYSYNYIGSEETIPRIGFIAQDISKLGYMNLLTLTPNENMQKVNDNDVEGAQMSVDYNKITAINFMMIKNLMKRIETLEAKLSQLT